MKLLEPFSMRDFSRGRIDKTVVTPALTPLNSVAQSVNVDYSEVIGGAIVRKGNRRLQNLQNVVTTGEGQTTRNGSSEVFDVNWLAQTFVPTTNKNVQMEVDLFLIKTGAPGDLIVQIQNTTAGVPNGTVRGFATIQASKVSGAGGVVQVLFVPITLTVGTTYAIVLKSPTSPDVANKYDWAKQSASVGGAKVSTNSGVSWSAVGAADTFYFQMRVVNVAGTYSEVPLGNFAGLIASTVFSVVSFVSTILGLGVIYWYSSATGQWEISNVQDLNPDFPVRFAVLKAALFEANGVQAMRYSLDRGQTWQVGTTNNITITEDSVIPSLLWVAKNRMLAAGYSGFPSRVYFSSIVDPNASNFITWNTDPDDGDWIDINPDDGGNITGFSDTSNLVLIFKNNAMYRLNTISKTVDSENIFNIGAVSQEGIVKCLGLTYFFSRFGIYRTDGGFPEMISRAGVQDFLNKILNIRRVYAGTDGFNVYFSIGNIRLDFDQTNSRQLQNVVLKFSPRDESWQVFTYTKRLGQFAYMQLDLNDPTLDRVTSAQFNGDIGQINYLTTNGDSTDYDLPIPYELETQELEMGNRSHLKVISDQVVIYTLFGGNGAFQIRADDNDFKPFDVTLNNRVNIAINVNIEARFFTFRWQGEANGIRPQLQGFLLPTLTDQGIVNEHS